MTCSDCLAALVGLLRPFLPGRSPLIAVQRRTRANRLLNARPSGIPAAFRSRYLPEEIEYHDLGPMDVVCLKCGAKH